MTKRIFSALLAVLMLAAALCVPAFAVDTGKSFDFALTVDGSGEKRAVTGDVVTVTFTLRRTDAAEDYTMYAVQNEILYDGSFFELVQGSAMTSSGIQTTDLARRDGSRAFYMNYVSLSGGETWKAATVVGTFQLRVIGTEGSSVIRSSNSLVSTKDGKESYAATAQDVTVVVSEGCVVRFESNGGTAVPSQTVTLGGKITRPDDPTKDGQYFAGWYSDIDLQSPWDFGKDTVAGNMTLYAAWSDEAPAAQNHFNWLWVVLAVSALVIAALVVLGRRNGMRRGGHRTEGASRRSRREENNE